VAPTEPGRALGLVAGTGPAVAWRSMDSTPAAAPGTPELPESAEPPVLARLLAFGSILLAGAAGGFIGWAFVDLQCDGDCTLQAGLVGLLSALGAAIGVGIVAVLALRALGEWQVQQRRGARREREPGLVARRSERPSSGGGLPRVR
jgi:hypothetical protein